jgi:peroxiredoxin
VVFIGITTPQPGDPGWSKTRAAQNEARLPYPTLLDSDGRVTRAYQAEGIPHTIVIDRGGTVRSEIRGATGEDNLRKALAKAGA